MCRTRGHYSFTRLCGHYKLEMHYFALLLIHANKRKIVWRGWEVMDWKKWEKIEESKH